jgi:hypothetical protein
MSALINRDHFFTTAKPLFGRYDQMQVEGINKILDAFDANDFKFDEEAYVTATAYWESAHTMQPVRETLANSDDQAIARLDAAWAKGQLKWVKTPYWRRDSSGKAWFGRGLVQLTFKSNYAKLSPYVGVDLVANPDAALDDEIAIKIMIQGMKLGLFTGKDLGDYFDGIDESDAEDFREYKAARKIINGTDKDDEIAHIAMQFEKALRR